MSAAQRQELPYTQRQLNEAEALYRIGHEALGAGDLETTLDSILLLGLRVAGVTGITVEPLPECGWPGRRVDAESISSPQGTAVAEIAAGGRVWGTTRVSFSISENGLESPLRFARFIGQQIGMALSRIELLHQREAAERAIAALERRLLTHKYVQRAKGVLAHRRTVSEQEALGWIFRSARSARRSLMEISQAIIFLESDERPHPESQPQPPTAVRSTQASCPDTHRSVVQYRTLAALHA